MTANVPAIIAQQAAKIVAEGVPFGPRTHPCVCGAARAAHSGARGVGKCTETGCRRYRADRVWTLVYEALDADEVSVGESLREYDRRERERHYKANPRGEGEWSIGASDTGTCPRKIEYRNRPPEGFEPAPEDQREARMGTIIHNEVTRWMKALYPWRLFDHPVQIAGLDRKSALDMYDPITGVVTDFKTAGDWRWEKLGEDGPDWETWEQVMLYALALEDEGYTVTRVRLVYVKRCNGHDENFEMEYDRPSAEQARDRLLGYAEKLDRGESLPKTGTGPSTDALCRRCFARFDCWNIERAQQLGRSPENLTILGEQPDDEQFAWAIEQKVTASKARLDAEKAEKEAKALVDGIPAGRYGPDGEWEAWEVPKAGSPLYKASYEQVLEYLRLPPEMQPDPDDLSPIRGRGYVEHKVGRVRKATLDAERKRAKAEEQARLLAEAEEA